MADWISTGERLPDEEGRYLIFYTQGRQRRIFVGDYLPREERWTGACPDMSVTHWMPLPAPPEENDGTATERDKTRHKCNKTSRALKQALASWNRKINND